MKTVMVCFCTIITLFANAQIKLPQIIRDSMILQRNSKINIWGWASKDETISVKFNNKTYRTTAGNDGKWIVQLTPIKASGPYTMEIIGKTKLTLHNILLGDPRPLFLSYGIPEKGDANWLDHRGGYKAIISAGEVYKFLGAKDLGVSNDYLKEHMPVNVGLLDGQLAWRQHDGGHTDAPNFKCFIPWADKRLGYEKNFSKNKMKGIQI